MNRIGSRNTVKLEKLRTQLADAALVYNTVRAELESFREDIHTRLEEYAEARSERWQESEAGQAHQTFREAWEEECAEECPEDVAEYPTEVEA